MAADGVEGGGVNGMEGGAEWDGRWVDGWGGWVGV